MVIKSLACKLMKRNDCGASCLEQKSPRPGPPLSPTKSPAWALRGSRAPLPPWGQRGRAEQPVPGLSLCLGLGEFSLACTTQNACFTTAFPEGRCKAIPVSFGVQRLFLRGATGIALQRPLELH